MFRPSCQWWGTHPNQHNFRCNKSKGSAPPSPCLPLPGFWVRDNNLHLICNTQVNKGFGLIECNADSHRCYSPKWHTAPQAYMTPILLTQPCSGGPEQMAQQPQLRFELGQFGPSLQQRREEWATSVTGSRVRCDSMLWALTFSFYRGAEVNNQLMIIINLFYLWFSDFLFLIRSCFTTFPGLETKALICSLCALVLWCSALNSQVNHLPTVRLIILTTFLFSLSQSAGQGLDTWGAVTPQAVVPTAQRNARLGHHGACTPVVGNLESDSCGQLGARPQTCWTPRGSNDGTGAQV